jgi:diguanylate cyclase (GGDEF)-like protein
MYLDSSPLTRLPGGIAIENVVNKLIITNASIAFCWMDIDNFKAYNDRYGYAKGNDLIQSTASIISEASEKLGGEDDFIGHIGGDDFILITTPDFYIRICESIVENFDKIISDFYDTEDRQRGYIIAENRQGQEVSVPLASISIAVVTNDKRKFLNHIQVSEVVSEIKELAKSVAGSVCLVDQRGNDKGTSNKDRKLISIKKRTKGLTD